MRKRLQVVDGAERHHDQVAQCQGNNAYLLNVSVSSPSSSYDSSHVTGKGHNENGEEHPEENCAFLCGEIF